MSAVSPGVLKVSAGEGGMKLLRFLERRLAEQVPKTALHKWIRTGQVRVNKGRAKPFFQLAAGDLVRIPPFALARNVHFFAEADAPVPENTPEQGLFHALCGQERQERENRPTPVFAPGADVPDIPAAPDACVNLGPDVRVVADNGHLLALSKPAGLPCQPGSGHEDNLCARLAKAFSGAPFIPAPAHRLDRHTSGLVLAGMTHAAQRRLHALFASGGITKEYLAWVIGDWQQSEPCLLEDRLRKRTSGPGPEGMVALPGGKTTPLPRSRTDKKNRASPLSGTADADEPDHAGADELDYASTNEFASTGADEFAYARADEPGYAASAAFAVCGIPGEQLPRSLLHDRGTAVPGRSFPTKGASPGSRGATLLLLRLFTGRTHQIRVQLASRGFPIIGDGRYGGPHFSHMLLHAFALSLPEEAPLSSAFAPDPPGGHGRPAPGRLEFTVPAPWPKPFMPDPALLCAARQRLASALAHASGSKS